MPVNTKHQQYSEYAEKWQKCSDCIAGEDAVKKQGKKYLPMPSGWEPERYDRYKFRATFLEFSQRVLQVSLGQLFRKNPVTKEIPDEIKENIDLRGTSFDYFWRQVASEVISKNRAGIFVDYSNEQSRPYLVLYKAESIINWQTAIIDGAEKLSLVVLEGKAPEENQPDIFDIKLETRWKVIKLENGNVIVADYRRADNGEFIDIDQPRIMEMNSIGEERNYLGTIPFYFVTTNGISTELFNPPIMSVVNLNLGHYRNYADYETMLFFTSQKTVITKMGVDKDPFPVGGCINYNDPAGDAKYLEASQNSGTKDELTRKEGLMAALSSAFLSGSGRYVASAETARITSEGEYATLADVSNALSVSATQIMDFFMEWMENKEVKVFVTFNTDFEMKGIDPALLTAMMGALGAGNMSFETFYYNLSQKEAYPPNWSVEIEKRLIDEYAKKQIEERDKEIAGRFNVQPGADEDI